MDEHLASKNTEKIQETLKPTFESERWRKLAPNLPSPGHDLLPQELDQDQLSSVINALKDLPLPSDTGKKISREPIDLGKVGMLVFTDHGESKICYSLERDGKKMAVLLQGYQSELDIQIPDDPHLTKITNTLNGGVWEYSSLRTYAMLPLPGNRAVRLQEYGEPAGSSLRSVASSLRGAFSRRSVINYIAQHVPGAKLGKESLTERELQQSRHLLTKPGYNQAIFIDIPVEQRH